LGGQTIPAWLHQAGYCTAFTGKYLNHYKPKAPRPPGWSFWEPIAGVLDNETGYAIVRRDGRSRTPGTFITDELARVSVAQLRDCLDAGKPAFLAVWPFAPHFGSDPAPEYASVPVPWSNSDPSFNESDITDKPAWLQQRYPAPFPPTGFAAFFQKRVRTLLSVDDLVQRLVSEVTARGDLDRTVFVLTSDNGYLLGEHRIGNRKDYAYDAAQGSFWIAGPGFDAISSDVFLQNTDLAPTILAAAAAAAPGTVDAAQLDGVALQRLLRDPEHGHDRFLPLYVPVEGSDNSFRPTGEGVRTWRYKYVRYADGTEELYDLAVDPAELTNVAGNPAYADRRAELKALAKQAKRCRGDTCRQPAPADLQR
jgi:arylsulfatase A-like enzyme